MPEHSTITDPNLHEPKDVATALVDQVYVANGSGSGTWILAPSVYGGIKVNDGVGTLAAIGTTPIQFSVFDATMPSNSVTVSTSTDDLTIVIAGDYTVSFCTSLSTVAVGDAGDYIIHLRKNGAEAGISTHRELSGTADEGSMTFDGIITLAASDVLTVFIESDDGGNTDDINILTTQFFVHLLKAS